jgi:hypothetical protein
MATKSVIKKKIDEQITNTVQSLNVNKVVSEIGELQVNIQSTLSGIAAQITGKLEELGNSEKAIGIMQAKLAELYQVEKELQTIEEIKAKKVEEEEKFKKMMASKNEEFDASIEEREKRWEREEEQHLYESELKMKKIKNEFADSIEEQKRLEKIRIEALTSEWAKKEAEISAKETEFVKLKDQVAKFPEVLEKEVAKEKAIVSSQLKNNYEHQIQLLTKDAEASKVLFDQKEKAFTNQINEMRMQIQTLNEQLESARTDSKEIAAQALQSAAGKQVVDALQKSMENKKN